MVARRMRLAAAAMAAVLATAPCAWPQSTTTLAEALFRDAKRLLEEGRYDEACPKFAESQRLDPSSGTLLGLALCHEGQGKLATAWGEFNAVVPLARRQGRPDREELATKKAADLEPRLARLTLTIAPGVEAGALALSIDGQPFGRALLGSAVPLDRGEHVVTAAASGRPSWTQTVAIEADGVRVMLTITIPAPAAATEPAPPPPPRPPGIGAQRAAAIVLGGAGVVGVGVGAYFGVQTLLKRDGLDGHCVGTACDASGLQTAADARTSAMAANVGLAAGALAIVGAAILWLTAPRAVHVGRSGLAIGGVW
jgi:hypothetical protein